MKYEYYKVFRKIYRIPINWDKTKSSRNRVEVYYKNGWMTSLMTVVDIMELNGKEITKEEAFMELI